MHAIQTLALLKQAFMFELVLLSLMQTLWAARGQPVIGTELQFRWPEPAYVLRYRDRLPPTRFSCATNCLCVPTAVLDTPLPLSDDSARQQALLQVEREYSGVRQQEQGDIRDRLRAELVMSPGGYPDLAALAERVLLSPRTLRRKLLDAASSYRELLDEALPRCTPFSRSLRPRPSDHRRAARLHHPCQLHPRVPALGRRDPQRVSPVAAAHGAGRTLKVRRTQ